MRLRGWHIDGFGLFHDESEEELTPGLNLFYGPNEAGKSTLLAFLRGVLFGFPRGNSKEPQYEPLAGGTHGGRVFLSDDAGELLTVERFARPRRRLRVTLPGGVEGSEADLSRALGQADRELFRSVFAFGLGELQSLASLSREGIQERIFSAGITGAGRSARDALRVLDDRATGLYRSGRGASRTADLVAALREVGEALSLRQEAARGYGALCEQEATLRLELDARVERAEAQRAAELRAVKLQELWHDVWNPLVADREELAKIEVGRDFPVDGAERLERCVSRVDAARDLLASVEEERVALERDLETVVLDDALHTLVGEVDALADRLVLHREHRDRLPELRMSAQHAEDPVQETLRNLGPDWDERALRAFDRSLSRVTDLHQWRANLEQADHFVGESEREGVALQERAVRARERAVDRARQRDELATPGTDRLRERARALAALRSLYSEATGLSARLEAEVLHRDRAAELVATSRRRARRWLGCAGILSLAGGGGAALWFQTEPFLAVALAALVTLAVLVSLAVFIGCRVRLRARRDEHADQQATCAELEAELQTLRERAAPACAEVGIDTLDGDGLERAEAALVRDRDELAEWQRREDRAKQAEEGARECEAELESHARHHEERLCERDRLRARWAEWKQAARVPQGLAPDSVETFFDAIRTGREALVGRDRSRGEAERLSGEIERWELEARRLLEESGDGPCGGDVSGEALIEAFARLRERCAAERAARERQRGLVGRLPELQARADARRERLVSAEADLAALLAEGGAPNEEAFRALARSALRRRELEARCTRQEAELGRRLGRGDEAEALLRELESGRVNEWEREAVAARDAASTSAVERDEVLRRHHEIATRLEELRASSELMELELRRSELREELDATLSEWRRVQVARGLIRATLERFERERQPEVLREASRFFQAVTGGRYPRIVQSTDAGGFAVLDTAERRKLPEELSRGTAEQLYVCIRLGLVAEFARRSRALPVVMDDVLVNFDDARARAMAEVLRDFAREHQLLFFTCSAATRDLLNEVEPEARVRRLGS